MSLSLIGPRGAGKSAVGRLLARMLDLEYLSTDEMIARKAGRTIAEIVAEEGWVQFRLLEETALAEAIKAPGRLLDTGGGIVELPSNRNLLRRYGPVVWLTAPRSVLLARAPATNHRPPLSDGGDPVAELVETLDRREPLYRGVAGFVVHNDAKTVEAVGEEVASWVRAMRR